jgi:homoserine dehydrogenase
LSPKEVRTPYYIRFSALDRPGVLSRISGVFGTFDIGLETIIQKGRAGRDDHVPLVIMTYEASEESMQNALREILSLDVVSPEYALLRVESDGTRFA